jgi:hypothetical protein
MPLAARLATEVGTRAYLRLYWGQDECPRCLGHDNRGYHDAKVAVGESKQLGDWHLMGEPADHAGDPRWPARCDHCGAAAPPNAVRQVFRERLYDTPSGELEPGCLYWATWHHGSEGQCIDGWTNCPGVHLMAVLPNGRRWDIDSRAANCALPKDTTHRCWVRTGELPKITVGKVGGPTCTAGAGSIVAGDYHGMLQNGIFT